jgi:hypothetical protein
MKAAGAVKYTFGDTSIPGHLQPVAVIELADTDPVPPEVVQYDVTYYNSPDLIPASLKALAAHAYSLGQAIPAMLRKICAVVVALIPVPITDGKSLKFNDITNSVHLVTVGV